MAAFNKFQAFVQNLGRKSMNLHTDVLKFMLTNVQPAAANAVKADITEIAAGNGYLAGGVALPNNAYSQAAGVGKLTGDNAVIVAAGGNIGPARWVVLYDDTALNDELIGWWEYGAASFTLGDGESLTMRPSAVDGILQIT